MYTDITSLDELNSIVADNDAVLVYFSHEACSVCKVLKPKIEKLVNSHFSNIKLFSVDTKLYPDVSAQNRILTAPTLIIYFTGKEFIRKSRNIGVDELKNELTRPYGLLFD